MIVRFATVLLALSASLGGLYGGTAMMPGPEDGQDGTSDKQLSANHRTDLIATPLITPGAIHGYIIGRYVIAFDAELAEARHIPLSTMVHHGVNGFFYRHAREAFWVDGPMDVPQIADGLKASINEAAGAPLVTALSIRQLDYLQSPEIRQPVISFDR